MPEALTPLQRQILQAMAQGKLLCAVSRGYEIHLGATRTVRGGKAAVATCINARTIRVMVEKGLLQQTIGSDATGRRFPMMVAPPKQPSPGEIAPI